MLKIIPFEENDKEASASHLQITTVPPSRERRALRKVTCYLASPDPVIKAEAPIFLEQRTPPSLCSCVRLLQSHFPCLEERVFQTASQVFHSQNIPCFCPHFLPHPQDRPAWYPLFLGFFFFF